MSRQPPVFTDAFGENAGQRAIDAGVLYDPLPSDAVRHLNDRPGLVRWPMPLPRRKAEEIERDFAERKHDATRN